MQSSARLPKTPYMSTTHHMMMGRGTVPENCGWEGLWLLRREDEALGSFDRWREADECQQLWPDLTVKHGGSESLRCR